MVKKNLSRGRLSGSHSRASVGIIVLVGFLFLVGLLPLMSEPVQAMPGPKFGYETKGGQRGYVSNTIIADHFVCPSSGTATSITVCLNQYYDLPKIKCAIYGPDPYPLVGYTEEWVLTGGWDDWKTLDIVWGGSLVEGTTYYLAVWSSARVNIHWDTESGKTWQMNDMTYEVSFPDFLDPDDTRSDRVLSIYCTYATPGETSIWQVGTSWDDVYVHWNGSTWLWEPTNERWHVGHWSTSDTKCGGGARFDGVDIPPGSTITSACLRINCRSTDTAGVVKSKIGGDDEDDAATFSTYADYIDRPRTTAEVLWDGIPAWIAGRWYSSPDIKAVIQEIIDRDG